MNNEENRYNYPDTSNVEISEFTKNQIFEKYISYHQSDVMQVIRQHHASEYSRTADDREIQAAFDAWPARGWDNLTKREKILIYRWRDKKGEKKEFVNSFSSYLFGGAVILCPIAMLFVLGSSNMGPQDFEEMFSTLRWMNFLTIIFAMSVICLQIINNSKSA